MKTFQTVPWNHTQCRQELDDFRRLLAQRAVLKEREDLLPFFRSHLHLSAFVGSYHTNVVRYDLVAHEYDLFGDFTCDLVAGDSRRHAYVFLEFEDAGADSIFVKKKGKTTSEWSPRFEHGFSQIVDWFYKLNDMEKTAEFEERFGKPHIEYMGLLVIGKGQTLKPGELHRLQWRQEKVLINSNKVHCITFDQLYQDLLERLDAFPKS